MKQFQFALCAALLACSAEAIDSQDGGGPPNMTTVGAGGSGGAPATPFTLEVTWEPCPLITGSVSVGAECASVQVPLAWDDADGRTIELFVKRVLPASGESERQIWFLAGGPGQAAADFEPLVQAVSGSAPNVSFYLLDHRGVGRSTRLGCEEQESLESDGANQITVAEMPACLADVQTRFSAAELAHFSTTEAAHDVGELVAHLRGEGEEVVVWGGSYGTHWANTYARHYPDQADAFVLGALAVGGELTRVDERFDGLARTYLDRCDADLCGDKFGMQFGQPARVVAADTLSGTGTSFCDEIAALGWTPEIIKPFFGQLLYAWDARKLMPPLIYRAARCNASDVRVFEFLGQTLSQPVTSVPESQRLWGMFMTHHVIKSELWTSTTEAELATITDAAIAVNGTSAFMVPTYDGWPVYDAPTGGLAEPAGRVLMTHGGLDFTPVGLYQPVVDHYLGLRDDNHFLLFEDAPHGLESPTDDGFNCAPSMMWTFARNFELPPSCADDVRQLDFVPATNSSLSFLGTADAWEGDVGTPLTAHPPHPQLEPIRARFRSLRPDAISRLRRH